MELGINHIYVSMKRWTDEKLKPYIMCVNVCVLIFSFCYQIDEEEVVSGVFFFFPACQCRETMV